MANRYRQRIRRVHVLDVDSENELHHPSDLLLVGPAVAAHRLLHRRRRVLSAGDAGGRRGDEDCAARLPDGERDAGVGADVRLLQRYRIRNVLGDEAGDPVEDRLEAQILALAGASWVVVGLLAPTQSKLFGNHAVTLGRLGFAISLPAFGVAHFIYDEFTAAMVPAWIPARMFWAYFTGAAHIAAGLSVITNIAARWGATLLAIMFTSFAILVNLARALELGGRVDWTGFCIATALTGAAWVVAGSLFNTRASAIIAARSDGSLTTSVFQDRAS